MDGTVKTFQGSAASGTLLKQVTTVYDDNMVPNPLDYGATYVNAVAKSVTTTWASSVSETVSYTHDWSQFQDISIPPGNPVHMLPLTYGSTLSKVETGSGQTRTTQTPMLWQSNPAYLTVGLLDVPVSTQVLNGSGSQATQAAYTTYGYDESSYSNGLTRGNVTTMTEYLGSTPGPTTHTAWNSNGTRAYILDANKNRTTFAYNQCGGSVLTDTWNALNHHSSGVYDCNTGMITKLTDPNGQSSYFGYDVLSRILTANFPDGGSTGFTYDDPDRKVTKTVAASPDPAETTLVTFDGLGREIQRQMSDTPSNDIVDTQYDDLGRVHSVSNPYRYTSDATYGLTTYSYDALNRKTLVMQPDNSSVSYTYGAAVAAGIPVETTTTTDEAGHSTERANDALGRLTDVSEDPNGLNYHTHYAYSVLGNLTNATQMGDGTGPVTRAFQYDSLSRLTAACNPETLPAGTLCDGVNNWSLTYQYDPNGNMTQKTDSRGVVVHYGHDVLNRVSSKSYTGTNPAASAIANATPAVSYTYDTSSYQGFSTPSGVGRRTGMSDGVGASAWGYDVVGRAASVMRQTGGAKWGPYTYSYNLDGTLASDPYGQYSYDAAGRATGLSGYVSGVTYTPSGAMAGETVTGEVGSYARTVTYNPRDQVTTMSALMTNPFGAMPQTVQSVSYSYSGNPTASNPQNNGNVWAINNNLYANGSKNASFTYDSLNRLLTAQTPQWGNSYTYEGFGNLLSKMQWLGCRVRASAVRSRLGRISWLVCRWMLPGTCNPTG